MSIDQRRFSRTPVTEDTIYFTHDNHDTDNDRIHYIGTIINISMGGIGLRSNIPHEANEELWFEGIEGYSGARPGKVRWQKDLQGKEQYELGIQF